MPEEKEYDKLPAIKPGTRPKVLLIGNGLNLSFENKVAIDDIIIDKWKENYGYEITESNAENPSPVWDLPFPMQIAAATKGHVQSALTDLAKTFKGFTVETKQEVLIKEILDTAFDAVLSTNYSLEIEKSTITDYTDQKVMRRYKQTAKPTTCQKELGIFQCLEIPYANKPSLWHIHGTALRKPSMIMGHFGYGKLMAEVVAQGMKVNTQYHSAAAKGTIFTPTSWIDYFLIGNVYILGFKLYPSEADIWWLLSLKKYAFQNSKVFFYDKKIDDEKKILLNCYDVETPSIPFIDAEKDAFINYYKRVCSFIKAGNPMGN